MKNLKQTIYRSLCLLLLAAMLMAFAPAPVVSAGTLEDIPDENLRALFREVLVMPYGKVNLTELGAIIRLNGAGRGIVDITGLEFCTNMSYVDLSNNEISDLGTFAKMYSVALGTNLRDINLKNNLISDVSPLAELTQLNTLNLAGNRIVDLAPFYAEGRVYSLTSLNLSGNQVTDVAPLCGMTSLQYLFLDNNEVSDLAPLLANTGLGNGDIVNLNGNPLDEVSVAEHIPALENRWVKVMWSPPPPPAPEATLTPVPEVEVSFTDAALTALIRETVVRPEGEIYRSDLERLTALTAVGRGITDLGGLEYCVNIRCLNLADNRITDISPLLSNDGLGSEDSLDLSGNPLSEASRDGIKQLEERGVTVITAAESTPEPAATTEPAAIPGDGPTTVEVDGDGGILYIIYGILGGLVLSGVVVAFLWRRRSA